MSASSVVFILSKILLPQTRLKIYIRSISLSSKNVDGAGALQPGENLVYAVLTPLLKQYPLMRVLEVLL